MHLLLCSPVNLYPGYLEFHEPMNKEDHEQTLHSTNWCPKTELTKYSCIGGGGGGGVYIYMYTYNYVTNQITSS